LPPRTEKTGERGAAKADRKIKKALNIKRESVFYAYCLINDPGNSVGEAAIGGRNSVDGGQA
jgi:hypothetical protein